MSPKTFLRGSAATLLIAGAIGFGAASAQTYRSYDESAHRHIYHHHRIHHHHHIVYRVHRASYAENERYREEAKPAYRQSTFQSERSDQAMPGENGMRTGNFPAAFQVPLTEIGKPTDELKRASVRDVDGNSVGYVRDIVTGSNGEVRALKINVGGYWGIGGKDVVVDASEFRYEKARNELTTDLPKKDLESMPAAKG